MRPHRFVTAAAAALLFAVASYGQTPLTSAFTYQGELASAGTPMTGTYDIRFRLYDAAVGGNQIGGTLCSDNLIVDGGRFAASLDFGSAAFLGQKRFLEIEVRQDTGLDCSDSSGYTVLSPRQELTAGPNALFAQNAGTAATAGNATSLNGQLPSFYQNAANLTGTLPSARLSGTYASPLTLTNPANVFSGDGAAITNLSAANIASGVLDAARMPTNWAAGGDLSGLYPSPTISGGAVTMNKLSPGVQELLSKARSLFPAPGPQEAIAWGDGSFGVLNVPGLPAGVTFTAVAAAFSTNLALRSDGTVVAWGATSSGQHIVPELPVGARYTGVAVGLGHCLALRSDGMVSAWGSNGEGESTVPALPAGVTYTAVSAGAVHSLALRSDGTIAAWGWNVAGQINVPALPPGLWYTGVAGGGVHSLALRSDGTVIVWGNVPEALLNVPTLPAGMRYTSIAGGFNHSLALRSDGTAVAWGDNSDGQLNVPALPPGLSYTAVAGGTYHSLALRSDGAAVAWGRASSGQLNVPTLPSGMMYTSVAAGIFHSLALRGTVPPSSLGQSSGLSIGSITPPPGIGGLSVAGASSFGAGVTAVSFSGSGAGLTNLNASSITSGILPVTQVPNLDASKITSGTLAAALVPNLDASKITSGTLSVAQIPNLDASKITSGALSDARLSANVARKNAANAFDTSTNSFAGNVGIGRADPSARLHVAGPAKIDGANFLEFGAGLAGKEPNAGKIAYQLFTANALDIVGAGTSGSNRRLQVFAEGGANFIGSVSVTGAVSKGGGSFKIDHPLDPENKYLYHSFVESPDMMNVYNGNVVTDANGFATITLPDYFEALNRDFRYQLTVVDEATFALVRVSRKIAGNTFEIASSIPNVEVSWQVTGIRKDAWAEKNRIPNSVDKAGSEKGKLLHPEAFGKPPEEGTMAAPAGSAAAAHR